MKNLTKLASALLLAFAISNVAQANPINGEIAFTGGYTVDNPNLSIATKFTSFTNVLVQSGTGDYAGTAGTAVNMTAFSWSPFPVAGVAPQWVFNTSPSTSFDLLTISINYNSSTSLVLSGTGTAHMLGKTNSAGAWNLTANTFGSTFSFSAGSSVPDGGMTALMLGLGLLGLGLAARRNKQA